MHEICVKIETMREFRMFVNEFWNNYSIKQEELHSFEFKRLNGDNILNVRTNYGTAAVILYVLGVDLSKEDNVSTHTLTLAQINKIRTEYFHPEELNNDDPKSHIHVKEIKYADEAKEKVIVTFTKQKP